MKHDDEHPPTLQHFHECDNCKAKGDIAAATASVGEFLMARMSEREMAIALTSVVLVLCEEQREYQNDAFEDFIRHLRTVWTGSAKERAERLTEAIDEHKNHLH